MTVSNDANSKITKNNNYLTPSNGTFSGADVASYIIFPGRPAIKLGQVTTLTYSTYRETTPVRTLGRINPKGFSKGQRTIAGTIIFTVFNKHVVNQMKEQVDYIAGIKKLKPCELPPFDIMLSFGNEYGASAKLFIYGIEIVDEGKIFSVEDMFTENTWSYMARDIDLMDDIEAETFPPNVSLGEIEGSGSFAVEDLVGGSDYKEMLEALEKIKNDKEAAIEEAREASKEYVTQVEKFENEQVIITRPIMPGGDNALDVSPENDPDDLIEQCFDITMRNCSSKAEYTNIDESKGERLVRVDFDIKWSTSQHSQQRILAGKEVKFTVECFHPDENGELQTISRSSTFKILDKSFTLFGDGPARLYVMITGYTQHTIKPTIKVEPLFRAFGYEIKTNSLLSGTKSEVKVFELAESDCKIIKLDGEGTDTNPLVFRGALKGSKQDQEHTIAKQTTAKITIKPMVPKLTTIPGRGKAANQQPLFLLGGDVKRNGTGKPIDGMNGNAIRDTKAGSAGVIDNGWIHPVEPNYVVADKYKNVCGINKDWVETGFHFKVELIDPDGNTITKSSVLKNYELVADYRMIVTIRRKTGVDQETVTSEITNEGENERQRYTWYKTCDKFKDWLESPRRWNLEYNSDEDIPCNSIEINLTDSIVDVYMAMHANLDPNRDAVIDAWTRPEDMLNPNICDCRFKYDDLIFEIYNFRVRYKDSVDIPVTRDICGNSSANAACRVRIVTLDDLMVQEINKL